MNNSIAVEAKNLTIKFKELNALDSVSLQIPNGKIVGLVGPSGAGKTTLIRSIVGRQKTSEGSITVFGKPAGSKTLRPQLGYMTQELSIYNDLTVKENIKYFSVMHGLRGRDLESEINTVIDILDLSKQADQVCGTLSGGQKQRVSLATSLVGAPKLLVLDEPTVGLDPVLREQIWKVFRDLSSSGTTVLVSSHVMDEAEKCDELVLIRDGKVVAQASPKSLKANTHSATVEESFLKLVGEEK